MFSEVIDVGLWYKNFLPQIASSWVLSEQYNKMVLHSKLDNFIWHLVSCEIDSDINSINWKWNEENREDEKLILHI